jgi:putative ABC transport system substrate-binding protein
MKRRQVIQLIVAGVAAWPLAVRADMPVIGYLSARSPEDTGHLVEAFRKGLSEAGFVEGQNVMVEYRGHGVSKTDCQILPRILSANR